MTCCNEIGNVLMFQVFPNQTLLQHRNNKIIILMQNLMNNQQTNQKETKITLILRTKHELLEENWLKIVFKCY